MDLAKRSARRFILGRYPAVDGVLESFLSFFFLC